jgi:hypothetical protein
VSTRKFIQLAGDFVQLLVERAELSLDPGRTTARPAPEAAPGAAKSTAASTKTTARTATESAATA